MRPVAKDEGLKATSTAAMECFRNTRPIIRDLRSKIFRCGYAQRLTFHRPTSVATSTCSRAMPVVEPFCLVRRHPIPYDRIPSLSSEASQVDRIRGGRGGHPWPARLSAICRVVIAVDSLPVPPAHCRDPVVQGSVASLRLFGTARKSAGMALANGRRGRCQQPLRVEIE